MCHPSLNHYYVGGFLVVIYCASLGSIFLAVCSVIAFLVNIKVDRAAALTKEEELSDRAGFLVADALAQPFKDGEFDLVWSLESGEHMPDKK